MVRFVDGVKVLGVAALVVFMMGGARWAAAQGSAQATLTISADKPVAKVSPTLYGLMTEEINYSYDGGLYAELVQDRNFLASRSDTENWVPVPQGTAKGSVTIDRAAGPSTALPSSLKVTVDQADAANAYGVRNRGWWGVPVLANTTYTGSVYAKGDGMGVHVSLVSNDSGKVLATKALPALSSDWRQYNFTMKTGAVPAAAGGAGAVNADNQIVVSFDHPGTAWLQLLSVFPPTYKNRVNGNRIDLMEKLAAMHPQFLRFPGGNYLEGDTIADRFDWKKTIGPLVDRPGHRSPWNYRSTDGFGLLEFLGWCEDLKMQPVLAVYAGYSLRGEHVEPGAALQPYVQDALDEIEYVTGDVSTKWGAERAKDGHPAAFPLNYVEIGNEDWFDKSGSYNGRYAQFYDAIKQKYPALQLIATTAVKGHTMDVLDDHYYKRAEQFYGDTHHYDAADRNGPKIFVGEWATREGNPTPNMGGALGDAAWMTGMERNSDLIVLSSYAPLLVNVNPGGMQWQSDLIGYNAASSYGSPSYYAQAMFASHVGTEILASELKGAGDRLFYSVTRDAAKGTIYLKLVNASSAAQPMKIALEGAKAIQPTAKSILLHGATTAATNSISDPKRVVPVESTVTGVAKEFTRTLPGYSVEVLELAVQ
ncbi:MAG: alpha-L-arabinofuranosidase C-terminal domain-containing protein [Acidobacteriaceae bacterium]|jgi:alpha-N-arabinofuranosidase